MLSGLSYEAVLSAICYLCRMVKVLKIFLIKVLSLPVHLYRYAISPYLRPSCRHFPSCSQYALDALLIHGPLRGSVITIGRILRCRPGGTHGYDPVPLFWIKRYNSFKKYKKCSRLK
jgi:uncharacterized protein